MKQVFVFVLVFIQGLVCSAQTLSWDDFVENICDYTNLDDEDIDEEYLLQLKEIHDNPYNLNDVTQEQLLFLPFLSESQAKDIVDYASTHSPVYTLGELMFIQSLSQHDRQMLMLFCRAGDVPGKESSVLNAKNLLSHARHEVTLRTDIPFYTKAGYKDVADSILESSPNKVYKGDRFYRSMRYRFTSMNHLDAGLQIEKDAGEYDFDYLSFYALLRNVGRIRTLALGDYRVSFGQGLVVNTNMGFGKAMMLSALSSMNRGISKHSSMSESGYFRGIAATIGLYHGLDISAFASYRNRDATLLNDQTDSVSTFKTDGLHRTALERSKKNNISDASFGGNLQWRGLAGGKISLGLTSIYTHLSNILAPRYDTASTLYRAWYPRGTDFSSYGLSYSYMGSSFLFRGETAMNHDGAMATINTAQYKPDGYNAITLIQRYYQAKYATLYAKSFGENSSPQNESGVYLGWNSSMVRNLMISVYADWFYFPFRKYQVSEPSQGLELLAQLTYTPSDKASFDLRYKFKSKQKDCSYTIDDVDYTILGRYTTQSLRLQHNQVLSPLFTLRTTLAGTYLGNPLSDDNYGFIITENLKYTSSLTKLSLSASWFNTDSYSSRIYTYEPTLLYSFGMTSFYYKGLRLALVVSLPIINNMTLNAKLGYTSYFDRETIGTALEQIDASHRTDLQLQLRYKF